MIEHHGGGHDGGQRICNSFARDIWRRPVYGFEHGGIALAGVDVRTGGQADAAGDNGGDVAQDITEQVRGDDDIEGLGASNEVHGCSVDEQRFGLDAGVISKQEFDNAQTGYDASVAQLKALDEQVKQQKVELHYYGVASPMDGIVGDVPVRVGDRVTVATILTTVDEPGALEAYIYVPADRAKNLKLGLPVRLLDNTGKAGVETQITFVSPQVDTDTQTVLAKATIMNTQAKLRIAQQVRAQITWEIHEGPVIPVLAVLRISGQFFAFVSVKEGNTTVARQKPLKLGDTIGNDFAVLEGLKPGDHIIVSGTQFLQDGMPITEQIQDGGKSATGR